MIYNNAKIEDEWKNGVAQFQERKKKYIASERKKQNHRAIHVTSSGVIFVR